MKYQYHVQTWGGFYNAECREIHGLDEGDFVFATLSERDKFINARSKLAEDMNLTVVFCCTEGYACSTNTVLHRVIRHKGKEYYSRESMGINCPLDVALYHMQNKWYPGLNDYPLGEDFNYDNIKVVDEWITGAFKVKDLVNNL